MQHSAFADRVTMVRPFYPALDGLRAIAFVMVFLFHYAPYFRTPTLAVFSYGNTGVDVFFVLSGFLITGILFDSRDHAGYFKNFYVRRSLRIFPLFYGFWLLMLVLTQLLHVSWTRYNVAMAAYVGNFFLARVLLSGHAWPGNIVYFSPVWPHALRTIQTTHFWTLCVEEQFYLVWPLVLWFVRSRSSLLRLCVFVACMVPVERAFYLHLHPEVLDAGGIYFGTFFRCDCLLIGSAFALWVREAGVTAERVRRTAKKAAVILPALFIGMHVLGQFERQDAAFLYVTIGYSLVALISLTLLAFALDPASWISRVLSQRELADMGRISYGLYFYHCILLSLIDPWYPAFARRHAGLLFPVVGFAMTYAVAWFSFRYYESAFLRLKKKFPTNHAAEPQPGHPAALPIATELSHALPQAIK